MLEKKIPRMRFNPMKRKLRPSKVIVPLYYKFGFPKS
jgi:hypothetical protein